LAVRESLKQSLPMTANNSRQLSELSRQELHELIWSTPATKVAADFGISDVAVAKRCKKLNVPRPSRGYWASLAAGCKPRKKPLPLTVEEVFTKEARKSVGTTLALPVDTAALHPLASELLHTVSKAHLDRHKRATLRDVRTLPKVTVSKNLAERVGKAFHVILGGVEPLGILFRKSLSCYDGGYFKLGADRLYLHIEEDLVDSSGKRLQVPSWDWQASRCVLSGYLTFSFNTSSYGKADVGQWFETAKVPLEKILAQIVRAIRDHFLNLQIRHAEEAIKRAREHAEWEQRTREWFAQEEIRLQKEREQKHAAALANAARGRSENLTKAAQAWRTSCNLAGFLNECERQWKQVSAELTAEQQTWLKWARTYTHQLSPFTAGYPDPVADGPFDSATIPFGGPYPPLRNL
jgi:hypothetical protein